MLLAFVVFVLGGLVAIPVAVDHRMAPVNREIRTLAEPGRGSCFTLWLPAERRS